jgi:radical SAM protein with 4Fe4S-binding SPASM domain
MKEIDIKQLVSTEKFIPFYAERKAGVAMELPPIAVELHWTSDCNYDCIHCSYGSRRQSKGRLSQECIRSVIEDLISLKTSAVYLSGGGEPTIIKGWDGYARQLLDSGIEVALITNSVALQSAQADVLSRMDYVAVSVYSTDESEYKKITDSHFFDRQWTAPGLIKSGKGDAIVGARCVINKINYKNIINTYLKVKESGYDYIIFIPAVDYEGSGIGLGSEEQGYVNSLISENKALFDAKFTNALDLLTRDISHYNKADYRQLCTNHLSGCSAVKIRANAFINYCGGVWLCQPHIGNPLYQIGNLHENRLSEIWNSSRHAEVVDLLYNDFSKGTCQNCRSIGFNIAGDKYDRGLVSIDNIPHDPFI